MPRKTKIIFIVTFILVGVLMLGWYFYAHRLDAPNPSNPLSQYNPFNSSGTTSNQPDEDTSGEFNDASGGETSSGSVETEVSGLPKLHQITDFAVSGAVFFEDMRPIKAEDAPQAGGSAAPKTETALDVSGAVAGGTKEPGANGASVKNTASSQTTQKFEIVPALRYVERMTGHMYEMYLDTKATSKISNSTIPTIYEAIFDGKANTVIYRYLSGATSSIESFMATLGGEKGEFLPSNITDISLSTDKTKFFYITETASGVTGTIRAFNETKRSQVWTSAYTEWLSQWAGPQKIYLTTKASGRAEGSMFSLNTATGTLTKVFGGVLGLTTLANSSGSLVLYSSSNGSLDLGILDAAKHTTLSLGQPGLPEKCVWASDQLTAYCAIPNSVSGVQPDEWYQGETSFNDHFVKIQAATGEVFSLYDNVNDSAVDATHLFLDKDEKTIFFINKKDSTLWSLDLR